MKKFMVLYIAPVTAESQMNVSPEATRKGMEPWMAWFAKAGSAVVDGGAPLGKAAHVGQAHQAHSGRFVTGYSVVQANDAEAVMTLLKGHPHLMMPEGSIEVHEMLAMPM